MSNKEFPPGKTNASDACQPESAGEGGIFEISRIFLKRTVFAVSNGVKVNYSTLQRIAASKRIFLRRADMFFEFREYRIKNGMRDQWVKLMEEKIIPFQTAKGMVVVGSFAAVDEPDLYVWIRRFENEAEAEKLYKEVYDSDHWLNVIRPEIDEMLDREKMKVTKLEATPKSVIR
jgi:hypothetical protein